MPSPIPPTRTRGAVGAAVGIASILLPLWYGRQSMRGAKDEWQKNFMAHEEQAEMKYMRYGMGHWSGQPWMDHKAHQLYGLMLFGPWGAVTTYQRFKTYGKGFFNDVIMKNILPIGLGVAGIYSGFGPANVNRVLKEVNNAAIKPLLKQINVAKILGGLGKGAIKTVEGLYRSFGFLFSAKNIKLSLPLIGATGFGLYRFMRVWNHDEQHEFWRNFTSTKGH